MNRIGGIGSERFFEGLTNSRLMYLSLASNPLDNTGVVNLSEALRTNKHLQILDLFDVEFSDEGAVSLSHTLIENKAIRIMHLSNTRVTPVVSSSFIKAALI